MFGILSMLSFLIFINIVRGHEIIKVGIIDTGLNLDDPRFSEHVCSSGHHHFVDKNINDEHGHGTHIAGLIQQYAGYGNYCFLIYKFYSDSNTGAQNLIMEIEAMKAAIRNGADIINFSGGGPEFAEDEYLIIKNHPNVLFVVAAGNEHENLDNSKKGFYPASYWLKNEVVVQNIGKDGMVYPGSNWSKKAVSEIGENAYSTLPNGEMGYLTGSSQATAIRTGKIVREMLKKRK